MLTTKLAIEAMGEYDGERENQILSDTDQFPRAQEWKSKGRFGGCLRPGHPRPFALRGSSFTMPTFDRRDELLLAEP